MCYTGCFWERQWAYVQVEMDCKAPFRRPTADVSSVTGYAGGAVPRQPSDPVCYHTGDGRDYAQLGHAEVVAVKLDNASAAAQLGALARDFFASFHGAKGKRIRPDPMDQGTPYRSVVGLPGGVHSSLYPVLARENQWGMELKPGKGGDADVTNVVWVLDTARFPFYWGEVYHQFHCNFFQRRVTLTARLTQTAPACAHTYPSLHCALLSCAPQRGHALPRLVHGRLVELDEGRGPYTTDWLP